MLAFTLMLRLSRLTKSVIHWHHLGSKPFIRIACCKEGHLPYHMPSQNLFWAAQHPVSPIKFLNSLVKDQYPFYNMSVCAVWITLWVVAYLFVANFVKILKLTLRRWIWQYCWIISAFLNFGNKTISPKFNLNNSSCPAWNALNISS